MNIRPSAGETDARDNHSLPNSGPIRKRYFLPRGCSCPRPARHGLGAAKEHPSYASAIPRRPAADPRPEALRAPWPVWSGSVAKPVRFAPMPKKAAVRLWHRARDFDRSTRQPGRHGGAVGHTGLQVLHALIFDFLNFATGRLDPSYAAIARKANVCERTVATALARLRELGILHWVRRCAESWRDGRFVLEQETNAYAVLPESQWRGYRPPAEAPAPVAGHVGRTAADAGCAGSGGV